MASYQTLRPHPHGTQLPDEAPVVVIGAGYAGLSAALTLHDHGVPALTLEGSDRVGGRILSHRTATGTVIDHGGQWVGPTQRHLLGWADRFGCRTFPTWDTGEHLESWHDGSVRRYAASSGPDTAPGLPEYDAAAGHIDRAARSVDPEHPTAAPGAREWDSETVHSFFQRTVPSADARRRLDLAVQSVWAMEPREISMLHLLFYVASAGGFEQLMETRGAAQDARFVEGAQAPALAAAEHLGESVVLHAPVRTVESADREEPRQHPHTSQPARADELAQPQEPHGAAPGPLLVDTPAGTVRTERVIVALPPAAVTGIRFWPQLPTPRARWLQRSTMGDVAKVHAVYRRPFWRAAGLSGVATLYGPDAVGVVFDNSPPHGEHGVLAAFVYGDRLRRWAALPQSDRRSEVLRTLERLYGPTAREPDEYLEKIWTNDPWAGGGYAANPAPGAWTAHGEAGWRAPTGPIHWAGTETASVWNGYMDGAISSGARAAHEVLAALGR